MAQLNVPIDVVKGGSKDLNFFISEQADITAAIIELKVQHNSVDEIVLTLVPNLNKSPNLETGEFVISIIPSDTANLEPRTYQYNLTVTLAGVVNVPLKGDFKIYSTVS